MSRDFYLNDLAARQLFQLFQEHPLDRGAEQNRPHGDMYGLGRNQQLQFGRRTHISLGVVEDYSAHAYCYRVRPSDGMGGPLLCTQLTPSSFGAFGAKDVGMYTPGSTVVVIKLSQAFGIILGSVPFPAYDARLCLSDQLSYATRTRTDSAHRKPMLVGTQRNAINWIANRPFDLAPGTHGWISATGLRLAVNDFMAQLGSGAACGVTAFYKAMLLRIVGYNLQQWTACREHFSGNDQEELHDFTGIAVYPWEQMGLFSKGDPRRQLDPIQFQKYEPHYAVWEPKEDKQRPFHRIQIFEGYLGQGGYRVLAAPPSSPPPIMQYEEQHKLRGVAADFTTLAGDRVIASARSVSLLKRILIPVPDRQMKPEDGRGDTPDNYSPSGVSGHEIGSTAEVGLKAVAGVLDMHAYLCNWAALHPFAYHAKDWYVPEEKDIGIGPGQIQFDYGSLAGSTLLTPPSALSLKVDDRHNGNYFATMSNVTLLPDGGIIIGDGYGASLTLSQGQAIIAAPGDVWLKAGRNVVRWSGWDDICRAQNGIDMSATARDVRIKAGANIQVLADKGGMLLESRANKIRYDYSKNGEDVVSSGIMLRAALTEITTQSAGVYLRTGSENGDVLAGPIVFDANRGKSAVVVHAANFNAYLQAAWSLYFGTEGNVTDATRVHRGGAEVAGRLYADGGVSSGGALLVNGSIAVANGGIVVEEGSPFVGQLEGNALATVTNALGTAEEQVKTVNPRTGDDVFLSEVRTRFYDSNKAGEENTLKQVGFSFRDAAQYRTADFSAYEDRWQQLARLGSATLPKWEEIPVKTYSEPETYPYPGKESYESGCYYKHDFGLFNVTDGTSNSRGGGYDLESGLDEADPLQSYMVVAKAIPLS